MFEQQSFHLHFRHITYLPANVPSIIIIVDFRLFSSSPLLLTRQSEINPSATNLFSPFASFSQGLILMLLHGFQTLHICLSMALLVILGDPTTACQETTLVLVALPTRIFESLL